MSWLDDMEAADPAYPGPSDDPWPGYADDAGFETAAYWGGEGPAYDSAVAAHDRQHGTTRTDEHGIPWTAGPQYPERDWRLARGLEAEARDIGLQMTVPQPCGQRTPAYEADAAAWGTGRGIEPDGPEAG